MCRMGRLSDLPVCKTLMHFSSVVEAPSQQCILADLDKDKGYCLISLTLTH